MNDAQFKRATWDVVQNATLALTSWGDIDAWDTSEVTDMSLALSRNRNEAGTYENNGNSNMTVFNAGKT